MTTTPKPRVPKIEYSYEDLGKGIVRTGLDIKKTLEGIISYLQSKEEDWQNNIKTGLVGEFKGWKVGDKTYDPDFNEVHPKDQTLREKFDEKLEIYLRTMYLIISAHEKAETTDIKTEEVYEVQLKGVIENTKSFFFKLLEKSKEEERERMRKIAEGLKRVYQNTDGDVLSKNALINIKIEGINQTVADFLSELDKNKEV